MKIAKLPTTGQVNGCGLINYATGGNQNQYQIPIKVDYTFNAKHSMFARYMLSNNFTPLFYDPSIRCSRAAQQGQQNHTVGGDRRYVSAGRRWSAAPTSR